jgi:hypothetical protein
VPIAAFRASVAACCAAVGLYILFSLHFLLFGAAGGRLFFVSYN